MAWSTVPANGKYWLKRARATRTVVDLDAPDPDTPCDRDELDLDVRIEDGRIRAVLPAGGAPCCCPGLDLAGGCLRPLEPCRRIAAGAPADLHLEAPAVGSLTLRAGRPAAGG